MGTPRTELPYKHKRAPGCVNYYKNKHVRVLCDNTAVIGMINKMGTSSNMLCNEITNNLWSFCQENNIWITATHIPGKLNVVADLESRKEYKEAEWQLNTQLFKHLTKTLNFKPEIDLFASRLNNQLRVYTSYKSDPYAYSVNAFALN